MFGRNLHIHDVDQFLIKKIPKEFEYWSTMKFSLAGRVVIVNQVLLSTLWFFINVWGDLGKVLKKIRNNLRNYLWLARNKELILRLHGMCFARKVIMACWAHGPGIGQTEPSVQVDHLCFGTR